MECKSKIEPQYVGRPWCNIVWLQVYNTVQGTAKLLRFLQAVVPDLVPLDRSRTQMQTRDEFIKDVLDGVTAATMAIRMT